MAVLKASLAKIDEVEEKYRDLYTQQGETWVFTGVTGIKTQADVDAALRARDNERTAHAATKVKLGEVSTSLQVWTDAAGEGGKPEDIKLKLEKLGVLEAAGAPDMTKNFAAMVQVEVGKIVDGRIKNETTKLQRQLDASNAKIAEQTGTIGTYVQKDERRTVHDAVRGAAVTAKCIPEAIGDILYAAGNELKLVDGKPQTEDGRDANTWLEDRKKVSPYFWPSAKGTGAGGGSGDPSMPQGNDNPFSHGGHSITKIGNLLNKESPTYNPSQAAKLAEAAGVPRTADGTSFQWHVKPAAPAK